MFKNLTDKAKDATQKATAVATDATSKVTAVATDATQKVSDVAGAASDKVSEMTSDQYAKRVDQILDLMEITARRAARKKNTMSNVVISAELRLGIGAVSIEAEFDIEKLGGEE